MMNMLFTIGHSTHTASYFIKLLNQHNISLVCDVRSQPYSRYTRHFNREAVKKVLLENQIQYLFCGEKLGGRSKNPSCYNSKGRLQYHLLSQEPLFKKGLKEVIKESQKQRIALMCSEADPLTCHRTILVCRSLCQTMSVALSSIQHILPDGSIQTHAEIEKALLDKFKIFPDMLRSEAECISEAYHRQAQKIAYISQNDSGLLEKPQQGPLPFENKLI